MDKKYADHTPWNASILLLLGTTCGLLAGLHLASQENFIIWLYTWSTLIGATTALIAGAIAYLSVLLQIKEKRHNEIQEKIDLKEFLYGESGNVYECVTTIFLRLRQGTENISRSEKEHLIKKLTLPEIFFNDLIMLKAGPSFALNISKLRKEMASLKKYLAEHEIDDARLYNATYTYLNSVYMRILITYDLRLPTTLEKMWEERAHQSLVQQ